MACNTMHCDNQMVCGVGKDCFICLISDPPPIHSGCACRGDSAFAHVECRAQVAEHRMGDGYRTCQTCDQDFTGAMRIGLADALWKLTCDLPEENLARMVGATNLASALAANGRETQAVALYRDALTVETRVLGAEDPKTLRTCNSLAGCMEATGNGLLEAELLLRTTHERTSRLLGAEHPDALTCANNLARNLSLQHKYAAAEYVLREVIAAQDKVKGEEHIHSLRSSDNLAVALTGQGKHAEAETVLRRVVHVQTRVCGADHPDTCATKYRLVECLRVQGKAADAAAILKDATSLTDLSNAAAALSEQGNFAAAESMVRRVLEIEKRALGPEHENVLRNLNNLALILQAQRKFAEAESLMVEVLALHTKLHGFEHHHTLAYANNLLSLLHVRGRCVEAQRVGRQVREMLSCMLADDHPFHFEFKDLLHDIGERNPLNAFASNLSTCLSESKKHSEAEVVLREVLAAQHRILGANHPNALRTSDNLEKLLRRQMCAGPRPKTSGAVPSLPAGTRVLVQRLVAKPEHNGKRARVLSFDTRTGRYAIALDDGKELSLKAECVARAGCAAAGCASEEATSVCSRCEAVRYCSRECQRADWKAHKPVCAAP